AQFYADLLAVLAELGLDVHIDPMPNEIAEAIPFDRDRVHASYDPDYAARFWRVLLSAHRVFALFRTRFLGKVSPVHFFWGSFDLAVTRFSGRPAPPIRAAYRICPMPWRAKPIRMRCPAPGSGRAAADRSTTLRSIPT